MSSNQWIFLTNEFFTEYKLLDILLLIVKAILNFIIFFLWKNMQKTKTIGSKNSEQRGRELQVGHIMMISLIYLCFKRSEFPEPWREKNLINNHSDFLTISPVWQIAGHPHEGAVVLGFWSPILTLPCTLKEDFWLKV